MKLNVFLCVNFKNNLIVKAKLFYNWDVSVRPLALIVKNGMLELSHRFQTLHDCQVTIRYDLERVATL